jgi:glycosyltransferase involved in cell wall biosynthesis
MTSGHGFQTLGKWDAGPKRLLVVSSFFPDPPTNGYTLRVWAILRALAAEGYEVNLLSFGNPAQSTASCEIQRICRRVEVVQHELASLSGARDYWRRLKAAFSPEPYGVARFRSEPMRRKILEWLSPERIDAVVCEESYLLTNFPVSLPVPLILDNHNLEHVVLERFLAHERNRARRAYLRLESRKLDSWERHSWSRASIVTACSEHDRRQMKTRCPNVAVAVVPNVVDADQYAADGNENPGVVLYQGGMDWFPNRDAVEFFALRILPQLRRRAPGVKFVIAGRSPSEEFRRRFESFADLTFTGTLPDLRPQIARATVCVVPLRIGSGTRLKVLEAAAMAKPIVSTRIGAEGLDFVDGEEILLADEPEDFVRATAQLLEDAGRRRAMGRAARRRVELHYSLPALRNALRQALQGVGGQAALAHEHELHEVTS